ncbi:MAG: hypothetical protein VB021_05025 [Oscillospiraceae bacterium]|nr:hypothetical protein [Oscillospiraceae bacterium]
MPDLFIRSETDLPADVQTAWDALGNADFVRGLFTVPFASKLVRAGRSAAGRVMLDGVQYEARLIPHVVRLTCADRYIALDFSPSDRGGCCAALTFTALSDEASDLFTQETADRFLARLRAAFEGVAAAGTAQAAPDAAPADAENPGDGASRRAAKKQHGRALRTAAGVLAALALLCGAYLVFYPIAYRWLSGTSAAADAAVNLASAQQILPGMSRSEVERLLGSTGRRYEDGTLYESAAKTGDSLAQEQVLVRYDKYIVSSVTYLNVTAARAVGTIGVFSASYAADNLTVDAIAAAVGKPVSMLRRYRGAGGDDMLEVHFGRADCFANFDPAWRGEYVVTADLTQKTAAERNWVGYDGSDPLLLESLRGTPAAAQYDSYTDFLGDKFVFDEALLSLNHYSRGDAKRIFAAQDMQLYDDTLLGGTSLYSHSDGVFGDEQSPLYEYTFGFDSAGRFRTFSFANMRLYGKRGTLAGTQCDAVVKGMSYNEVRNLVQLVPTALIVDDTTFTVCYGHYVEADDIEGQFEFMVRFDIASNYAQTIYNNIAKAAAADAAAQGGADAGDTAGADTPAGTPDAGTDNTQTQGAGE